jgi:alcohol dehydrogenase class IV
MWLTLLANIPHGFANGDALNAPTAYHKIQFAALISGLGLPTRLRDVGVKPEQLDQVVEGSVHDRWIHTPRKIDNPSVIRTLLDAGRN